MQFTKSLRERVVRGEITCSIRIWQGPRVTVGGRYPLGEGLVHVTSIHEIRLEDITPDLARRSGFKGVVDLLKVAKHGRGEKVYLVGFAYERGDAGEASGAPSGSGPKTEAGPLS